MKFLFRLYKLVISPLLHGFSRAVSGNPYSGCKFEPTCSCYCEQAIQKHGIWKGSLKGLFRVLRCHPLSRSGGYDPL